MFWARRHRIHLRSRLPGAKKACSADCMLASPHLGQDSSQSIWEEMPLTGLGMGSSARRTIQALCFLLLLLGAGSAKNLWKRALQARLPEKSRAEELSALGPGPRQPRADRCPPPPRLLPPGACQAVRCQADADCPRHKRCCYNGCVYACLEAVPPPPAEACSTTEDGAEPLLCPTGYECHILSPGDMAEGIPNRGQCVKQRRQTDGRFLRHKFHREYPDGDSKNVAEHGRGQQRHVQGGSGMQPICKNIFPTFC